MGYLVKGKSFPNYYAIKFRKAKFKPFKLYFDEAESADQAMEMARHEIQKSRCETVLLTSVEECNAMSGSYHPYGGVDYTQHWWMQPLIAWDVETTGLDPKTNRIIELGYSLYNPETKSFDNSHSFFINDGHPVTDKITEITGITQDMIDNAPPFKEVWEEHLVDVFSKAKIGLAHNRGFDLGFLFNSLKRNDLDFNIPQTICTMELALRFDFDIKNNRLGTLGEFLAIDGVNSHRAGDDAQLCGNVGLALLRRKKYFHTANTREFFDYFDKYSWVE